MASISTDCEYDRRRTSLAQATHRSGRGLLRRESEKHTTGIKGTKLGVRAKQGLRGL